MARFSYLHILVSTTFFLYILFPSSSSWISISWRSTLMCLGWDDWMPSISFLSLVDLHRFDHFSLLQAVGEERMWGGEDVGRRGRGEKRTWGGEDRGVGLS